MVLVAAGCAGARAPEATDEALGSGPLARGLQSGEWTYRHPNGQPESRGGFEADERSGLWTHWYEDGTPRMRGEYRAERQEGPWEFWHPNGRLHCRGEYVRGREHGEWTFWAADGSRQQRGCFVDGRRTLEWTEWDPSGREVARGSYRDDRPVGAWRTTDAGGAVTLVEYPLPDGVTHVRELWPASEHVRREGFLVADAPQGLWSTRHEDGSLRALVSFEAGAPAGELSAWLPDGACLARGLVDAEGPAGSWRVRSGATLVDVAAPRAPRAPWDRRWSYAEVAATAPPLDVAARWLDELRAPREVLPRPVLRQEPAPAVDPTARLEAPTDPGHWTVREREELTLLRRYYRDGWLPRRHAAGARYGAPANAARLGSGDAALAARIEGAPLPHTTFPCADGTTLDLGALAGKRVLLVVLRGFTSQVCVYCFAQTTELAPRLPEFDALGCEVVVLFPGSRSRMEAFAEACREEFGDEAPPYHLVYDPDLALAHALGLEGNLARPAAFVLGADRIVRRAYVAESEQNIADRPSVDELARWVAEVE